MVRDTTLGMTWCSFWGSKWCRLLAADLSALTRLMSRFLSGVEYDIPQIFQTWGPYFEEYQWQIRLSLSFKTLGVSPSSCVASSPWGARHRYKCHV